MNNYTKTFRIRPALFTSLLFFGALVGCFTNNVYAIGLGDAAPDFTLETTGGERIILKDVLKEKKAVLVFWATWCPHCAAEAPHVENFYRKNKGKVAVIGINEGESRAKVAAFAEKKGLSYPMALDSDGSVANAYGVRGVPTIIAVGKDAKILYYGHSINEAENENIF